MSDYSPYDDADFELASAYLDHEATPDERARVEASPTLLHLVAVIGGLQDQVAYVAPLADPGPIVTRALDAGASLDVTGPVPDSVAGTASWDAPSLNEPTDPTPTRPSWRAADAPAQPAGATVTSLADHRTRRPRWNTPLIAAAAVITVVGLGWAALRGPSSNSVSTSAKVSSDAASPATSTAAAAPAGAATTAVAAAAPAGPAITAAPATVDQASTDPATKNSSTSQAPDQPTTGTTGAAAAATTASSTPVAVVSATTAGPTATTVVAGPVTVAPAPGALTILKDSQGTPILVSPTCPLPGGIVRPLVSVTWNGQPALFTVDAAGLTSTAAPTGQANIGLDAPTNVFVVLTLDCREIARLSTVDLVGLGGH